MALFAEQKTVSYVSSVECDEKEKKYKQKFRLEEFIRLMWKST